MEVLFDKLTVRSKKTGKVKLEKDTQTIAPLASSETIEMKSLETNNETSETCEESKTEINTLQLYTVKLKFNMSKKKVRKIYLKSE